MKYTIVFILGEALCLMLFGLAYLLVRRSIRAWHREPAPFAWRQLT